MHLPCAERRPQRSDGALLERLEYPETDADEPEDIGFVLLGILLLDSAWGPSLSEKPAEEIPGPESSAFIDSSRKRRRWFADSRVVWVSTDAHPRVGHSY